MKFISSLSEAAAQDLVKSTTSIPVPAVRRIISDGPRLDHYLVMEYIPGQTLEKSWDQLSFWRKLVIIWTLRGYVRQFRRVPFCPVGQEPRPGPIGDEPLECDGRLFGEMVGAGSY